MRIGIIDDDLEFIEFFKEQLYPKLIQLSSDSKHELVVSEEMMSNDLLNTLDVVFFDIQLKNSNSIPLIAEAISQFNTKFVFLSSKNDLVFDALKVKPLTFIRKNNLPDDFDLFLALYKDEIIKKNIMELTNEFGRKERIYIEQIVYFTACAHDVSITTINGKTYRLTSSLKKTMEKVNSLCFVQIQKSTCINMKYIVEMKEDCVFMEDGSTIAISRYFRKNIKDKYLNYLLDGHI